MYYVEMHPSVLSTCWSQVYACSMNRFWSSPIKWGAWMVALDRLLPFEVHRFLTLRGEDETPVEWFSASIFLYLRRDSPGRVQSPSPRGNHGDDSWVVSTPRFPVSASLHFLALQLKPSLCGLRAPERPLFTPSFLVFRPGDARDRSLVGRCVLISPPFAGIFCRSVGAQSTTQPWRVDPLTPLEDLSLPGCFQGIAI